MKLLSYLSSLCFLSFVAFLVQSCGYSVVTQSKSFKVDIFDNQTERRGHEFTLTQKVIQILKKSNINLLESAQYTLKGRIKKIKQEVSSLGSLDEVIAGSIEMIVEYEVIDNSTSEIILRQTASAKSSFSNNRNKTQDSSINEVTQLIGDSIAIQISQI